MTMISRRNLLIGAGTGLIAAPAILRAQQVFAEFPFRLGIASGDPTSDGFVIWTRLAVEPLEEHGGMPMWPIEVEWYVYDDPGRKLIVQKGTAIAAPELGHSVHVEVSGLQPDRPYWYRFIIGREKTVLGRTRTLPLAGKTVDKVRFGVAGCQHYEEGLYTAYRHLAGEDVDFIWHYGDYIYEDRPKQVKFERDGRPKITVRDHVGTDCYTLGDYRIRYSQTKLDPDLQLAHVNAPWFVKLDDHEVTDNWTGQVSPRQSDPALFAFRRAAAFQAYYENMPLRRSSLPSGGSMQIYRRARIGNLLDAHFLDTRQFRSKLACSKDDYAPWCAEIADPRATVMGAAQEQWLDRSLREKGARWNLIAQQVMMMPIDRRVNDDTRPLFNTDSWAGYDAARERALASFKGLGNVVVMTGDEHQHFAGELRRDGGHGEAVAVEFVSSSVSSGGNGSDHRAGAEKVLADNPFLKFSNDQRGYMVCEVTPDLWTGQFKVVDQVTEPNGKLSTRAIATVEHGQPALNLS